MSKRAAAFRTWNEQYDEDTLHARERGGPAWQVDAFVDAFDPVPHPTCQIEAIRGRVAFIGNQARWRASMDYNKMTGRADYARQAKAALKAAESLRAFKKMAAREGRPITHDFFDRLSDSDFLAPERSFENLLADCERALAAIDDFVRDFDEIGRGTNQDRLAWWFVKGVAEFWDYSAIEAIFHNASLRNQFALAAWRDLELPMPTARERNANDLEWMRDRFDAFAGASRELAAQ